jgi:hypothetical protein
MDFESMTHPERCRLLALLAHGLTVCGRGTYEAGTARVLEPEALRLYNELQHQVTGSLRDHLSGAGGVPVVAIIDALRAFAKTHERGEVEPMIAHALSLAREATA